MGIGKITKLEHPKQTPVIAASADHEKWSKKKYVFSKFQHSLKLSCFFLKSARMVVSKYGDRFAGTKSGEQIQIRQFRIVFVFDKKVACGMKCF